MVSQEFNRLIEYYRDAHEIKTVDESSDKKERQVRDNSLQGPEPGFTKIFIGMGKMDGITPKNLMDLINDYVEGRVQIGRIDFFTRYSLFDVEDKSAKRVVEALRELDFLGRNVKVDFATEEQMSRGKKERAEGTGDHGRRPYPRRGDDKGDRPYSGGGYKGKSSDSRGGEGRGYGNHSEYGRRSSSDNKGSYGKRSSYSGGKSNEGFKKKKY
jgi:ATP-dependent RNA helicase DeaD